MSYTTAPSSTHYPTVSRSPEPWSGAAAQYGCFGCGLGAVAASDCDKYLGVDAAAYLQCTGQAPQKAAISGTILGAGALVLAIWFFSAFKR